MVATEARRIGGRYQLGEQLGRGGMATVHRASDTQLGRDVAIKLMRDDLAGDGVFEARFVNEARSAASISHPNVVTVLDFGTDGPGPYLVMELVEGGDLAKLIEAEGPLPLRRAARIAADVASALQAAHAHGIVHRDVKPGNILLDADGRPRVADFGIAHATGERSLTGTGTSLGSVDYFSPEQARGEAATPASDIYSLGVVLYEMLTGRRPFTGDTPYAVAIARIDAPPPDPRAVKPGIPKALAGIVQRAMAVDPSERFSSASEMGAALAGWLPRYRLPESARIAAGAAAAAATPGPKLKPVRAPRRSRAKPEVPLAAVASSPVAPAAAETRPVAANAALPAPMPAAVPMVVAPPAEETASVAVGATPAPLPIAEERSDRRRSPLLLAAAAVLLLAVIGFAGGRLLSGPEDGLDDDVVVGEPRGGVFGSTAEPTSRPASDPTSDPTASPTPAPTVAPTATPAPVAAATPVPTTPAPVPATPAPTPVIVAMAVTPDQTVATWYSYVVDGEFDAAYALWSDRMRANFPRAGNLDSRWGDTADVSILQLYVTSQTANNANVFIDFIETKDDGSSRRFTGSWDLVRSGDAWLLDQPHF